MCTQSGKAGRLWFRGWFLGEHLTPILPLSLLVTVALWAVSEMKEHDIQHRTLL